jgi:hypothetical protein
MQMTTVWQFGGTSTENANNFATISQWWASLNGKEITWRQRLIPQTAEVHELDWEPQRFDEKFALVNPEIRGITLYWSKPDSQQARSTTPHKLELDNLRQQLYIFPQSQKEIVIRVGLPEVIYQTIELKNPQWRSSTGDNSYKLILRDEAQQLEIKVALSPENLNQLKRTLPPDS